jgi:hypothetical protein
MAPELLRRRAADEGHRPLRFGSWAPDSNSLYMALFQGKASDGVYRITVPQSGWERLTGAEGIDSAYATKAFVSPTPAGQPAVMSRTGAAQNISTALAAVRRTFLPVRLPAGELQKGRPFFFGAAAYGRFKVRFTITSSVA